MAYNPQKHHRRSIRLKGYDYSRAGLYFITICTQNRACLFGKIENGAMILNDAGQMVKKWYHELENKYPDKRCHEMVVMPNHFHCIIENIPMGTTTMGATTMNATPENDGRGHPENDGRGRPENDERVHPENQYGMDNKKNNATIGDAIGWFKTMSTNEYIRGIKTNNWQPFD